MRVMDSAKLTEEMGEACEEEFGPPNGTEQWPSKYFRYDVTVTAPDGSTTPRAPKYCATDHGGVSIERVLLNDLPQYPCKLRRYPPMQITGGWSDSDVVPWAAFEEESSPDGSYTKMVVGVNCGLLLDYFNHGWPPSRARNSCELEIYDAYVAAGMKPPLTEDQRQAIMAQP
jgi:hypothetical protein